jgi:hypothetical protein
MAEDKKASNPLDETDIKLMKRYGKGPYSEQS